MLKSTRHSLMAGASALAILAGVGVANAVVFNVGYTNYVVPATGEYALDSFGASGGNSFFLVPPVLPPFLSSGGLGAEVLGDVRLYADEHLYVSVGQQGSSG
jgi:hypothetical protein